MPAVIVAPRRHPQAADPRVQLGELDPGELAAGPARPLEASAARPPAVGIGRHRFADIGDTRNSLAASRSRLHQFSSGQAHLLPASSFLVNGQPATISWRAAPSGASARLCTSASAAIGFWSHGARAGPLHVPDRGIARAVKRRARGHALVPRPASAGLDRPLELARPGADEHFPHQVHQRAANHQAEHAAKVSL